MKIYDFKELIEKYSTIDSLINELDELLTDQLAIVIPPYSENLGKRLAGQSDVAAEMRLILARERDRLKKLIEGGGE